MNAVTALLARIRDPFSAISHYIGAGVALAGAIFLLMLSWDKPLAVASFSIYGFSLVALYLASAIYHTPVNHSKLLQRFDHAAIYLMIFGTYVPIALLGVPGSAGLTMLALGGVMGLIGIITLFSRSGGPKWLRVTLCSIMGWLALFFIGPIYQAQGMSFVIWMLGGGVVFTAGTVIYSLNRPRLWPGKFGAHDLWHIFVIGGSLCHYVVMLHLLHGIRGS